MKTQAVFFPFDLFGSSGTRQGVELLADAFQEMLADNKREKMPTRARCYTSKVRFEEFEFDTLQSYADWRQQGRDTAAAIRERGDFLLWVAGNHLGVLPVYESLGNGTDGEDTVVVQFDAHLDIYNLSDCTAELSHGNFLLHAESPLPAIVNVGHRELLLRPEYIAEHFRQAVSARDVFVDVDAALGAVKLACAAASQVFIDIDCDVFDAAYFPGSAHPQPFGLSPQLVLRFLEAIWSERVVGVSLSEFEPARDRNDQSLSCLVWLIEHILLKVHERRRYSASGGN